MFLKKLRAVAMEIQQFVLLCKKLKNTTFAKVIEQSRLCSFERPTACVIEERLIFAAPLFHKNSSSVPWCPRLAQFFCVQQNMGVNESLGFINHLKKWPSRNSPFSSCYPPSWTSHLPSALTCGSQWQQIVIRCLLTPWHGTRRTRWKHVFVAEQ